jgi:hypothetical protein
MLGLVIVFFMGGGLRGQEASEMSEAEKRLQFLKTREELGIVPPKSFLTSRPKPKPSKPATSAKPEASPIPKAALEVSPGSKSKPRPEATPEVAPKTPPKPKIEADAPPKAKPKGTPEATPVLEAKAKSEPRSEADLKLKAEVDPTVVQRPKFRLGAQSETAPKPQPTPAPEIAGQATPSPVAPARVPPPTKIEKNTPQLASLVPPSIRLSVPGTERILMVGDSMAVGEFGEVLQQYLVENFGRSNVALYASCGSSPEHWLRAGPNFVTKCGYREQSPGRTMVCDFENGRAPHPVATPRLEDLLPRLRPTTVIVQLGTNWMDSIEERPNHTTAKYEAILNAFISALRSPPNPVRRIIWITPPDASRYSSGVKRTVDTLINDAARRLDFEIIDSGPPMTHYVRGKSGGDGVHYNGRDAKEWAAKVTVELNRKLQRERGLSSIGG